MLLILVLVLGIRALPNSCIALKYRPEIDESSGVRVLNQRDLCHVPCGILVLILIKVLEDDPNQQAVVAVRTLSQFTAPGILLGGIRVALSHGEKGM